MTAGAASMARLMRRSVVPMRSVVATVVLSRVIVQAALWLGGQIRGRSFRTVVTAWDGSYYRQIAEHGYPHSVLHGPNGVAQSRIAFFPLYPALAHGITTISGLDFAWSGLIVSALASVVATILVVLVVARITDAKVALLTGVLFVLQPIAFIFAVTYADALLAALAAGALLALLRERWILAGLASLAAGATRPTGVVLTVCCLVAALVVYRRDKSIRPFAAVLIAPWGAVAYVVWIGRRTGRSDAWFATERGGWGSYFDFGIGNVRRIGFFLAHPFSRPDGVAVICYLLVVLVLLVLLLRQRPPLVVVVYVLGFVGLAFATRNTLSSSPRYLLPTFPLLIPIAQRIPPLRARQRTSLLIGLTLVMSAAGVYFMTISHYPP